MGSNHVDQLKENLTRKNFSVRENISSGGYLFSLVGHRNRLQTFGFGSNDYFFTVSFINNPTLQNIEEFSRQSYLYAKGARKSKLPVGLFGGLYVVPVALVDNITDSVRKVIETKDHSKLFSLEYPIIIDVTTGTRIFLRNSSKAGPLSYFGIRGLANRVTAL
jgi:hypothetical protein